MSGFTVELGPRNMSSFPKNFFFNFLKLIMPDLLDLRVRTNWSDCLIPEFSQLCCLVLIRVTNILIKETLKTSSKTFANSQTFPY